MEHIAQYLHCFQDVPFSLRMGSVFCISNYWSLCTHNKTAVKNHTIILEGAQRVHISAKYTIMLWCTRLYVYISTSLVMYVSPANDNDVIDNDGVLWRHCRRVQKNSSETVLTFLYISSQPHFDFEPDYVVRKPRKWRFQWCIVRTKIFLAFHARVEYISVKTVIEQIDLPTRCSDDAAPLQSIYRLFTDRIKASQYIPVHSVHLVDIIIMYQQQHLHNGLLSGTTRMNWYQKGKTNLDLQ